MSMSTPSTLTFSQFWEWLEGHVNCITSAGTPDSIIYDHDDFHWSLVREEGGNLLVQVIRGKHLVGEIMVEPGDISYVRYEPRGEEEFLFECVTEGDLEPEGLYYFTLSHAYNTEAESRPSRWVH